MKCMRMNRCSSEGTQLILDADISNLFTLCYDAVTTIILGGSHTYPGMNTSQDHRLETPESKPILHT